MTDKNTFYNMLPEKQRKFPQILYVGNNLSPNYLNDLLNLSFVQKVEREVK